MDLTLFFAILGTLPVLASHDAVVVGAVPRALRPQRFEDLRMLILTASYPLYMQRRAYVSASPRLDDQNPAAEPEKALEGSNQPDEVVEGQEWLASHARRQSSRPADDRGRHELMSHLPGRR